MILLAEHDEPSLAAKKKQRPVASEKATSPSKNRVWNFFGSPLGRTCSEPDLSAETATGSVQFTYKTASGQGYYYTRDHLGSVREMTNSSGAIQAQYDYDPYGNASLVQGTNMADFQYAGMYEHQTSGLNLTLFRAYDPNTGRWLSRDPVGESVGSNLYGYVNNSPIIGIDPLGLDVAVVISGYAGGDNVFGHAAAGVTGDGTYSFGTKENLGSSFSTYLADRSALTNNTIFVIPATPAQDLGRVFKIRKIEV